MFICLVGADFEENLALCALTAVADQAGHRTLVLPFNNPSDQAQVVEKILAESPKLVGFSIQFQHRVEQFVAVAKTLRAAGYEGHLTAGGHFPTAAYRELLEGDGGLDTIVMNDGEQTFRELLAALDEGTSPHEVAGLALLDPQGNATRTRPRPPIEDLDTLPLAKRYRPHTRHLGIPFIPISGGRGCWGKCSFCSIASFHRAGRARTGGRLLRLRSPENIAAEMALLWYGADGAGIFCFHDDNFLLPRPDASLARLRQIRAHLDEYGVGPVALVGKCRPETLTNQLAMQLAELGVIRLYVGIENASEAGATHLDRKRQYQAIEQALAACDQARIFACYNLLLFEPATSLADVRQNVRFIRRHADLPVNFCRAEPYLGTPLQQQQAAQQRLVGDFLGFNYRLEDDRAELLFRICSAAFRERNFACDGVANRYMGLGYNAKLLERFHGTRQGAAALVRRANYLTRQISLDTAEYLEKAIALAERLPLDDRENTERYTALLGLEIAAADRHWHAELDELFAAMKNLAEGADPLPIVPPPNEKLLNLKRGVALGISLAAVWAGCGGKAVIDGTASGSSIGGSGGQGGGMVADPLPPDGGGGGVVYDPLPPDGGGGSGGGEVDDPLPPDGGGGYGGGEIYDPAPPPYEDSRDAESNSRTMQSRQATGAWRDTSPAYAARTADLPMFAPPKPQLVARRQGKSLYVELLGVDEPASTRWESEGQINGLGRNVRWTPKNEKDRLRAAVRTRGGVAVISLGPNGHGDTDAPGANRTRN